MDKIKPRNVKIHFWGAALLGLGEGFCGGIGLIRPDPNPAVKSITASIIEVRTVSLVGFKICDKMDGCFSGSGSRMRFPISESSKFFP